MCHIFFDRKFSSLFIEANDNYHLKDNDKMTLISGSKKCFFILKYFSKKVLHLFASLKSQLRFFFFIYYPSIDSIKIN